MWYESIISGDKITFTAPYKFSSGKWLSDICIRTDINDDILFDDMTVAILGDCFENILRLSSLMKIK